MMQRMFIVFGLIITVLFITLKCAVTETAFSQKPSVGEHLQAQTIFLPLILSTPDIMRVGAYQIDHSVDEMDTIWETHHSVIGTFIDFAESFDGVAAEERWAAGYTMFVNLMTTHTAAQVADGQIDAAIVAWTTSYKEWQDIGGGRKMFLAPFPEMNGSWTPYGMTPSDYKSAYAHVRALFATAGATAWWVFAPNGVSSEPYTMSDYYPGDASVDFIGFSAFNWGTCQAETVWQNPNELFDSIFDEIEALTNKRIIAAQIGSTRQGGNKEEWIAAAYTYLISRHAYLAIYFNTDKECDWAIYTSEPARQSAAYHAMLQNSRIGYRFPIND